MKHLSIYDAVRDKPETLNELTTFITNSVRLMHQNMRIIAKEMEELRREIDDFKRDSLPAKTFGRVNRLEQDFIALRAAFEGVTQ